MMTIMRSLSFVFIAFILFTTTSFSQIKSIEDAKGMAKGVYTFDFGNGPFKAYIDEGGWMLWLQYHHKGGTNPGLNIIGPGKDLPVFDASGLGTDNSTDKTKWGHGSQLFAKSIPDADLWLRWEAVTSGHNRKIHFKSSKLGKFQNSENANFLDIAKSFVAEPDHTAFLPKVVDGSPPNPQPDQVLTHGPYWKFSEYHWHVGGNRWEVDDENTSSAFHTIHRVWVKPNAGPVLNDELVKLKNHILGLANLSPTELTDICVVLQQSQEKFKADTSKIAMAMDIIATFDKVKQPVFMTSKTINGFNRDPLKTPNIELERTILCLQQIVFDNAYSSENLKKYPALFNNFLFKCSAVFPGSVAQPTNANLEHTANVKCKFIKPWGMQPWYSINQENKEHTIRPTGYYLAPGSMATVEVPSSLVGKGYAIRVGAHVWDLSSKTTIKRMDRVSKQYPIDSTHVRIANPLGGGIYIYIPSNVDEGIVEIKLKNVVKAPLYSHKSFDKTSVEEWQNVEMKHTAPWTDFESDKVFAQVPTAWIKDVLRPDLLMNEWDKTINATQDMLGRPRYSDCHQNYFQIDVIIRGSAYFPGYPMSNTPYNPWSANVPSSRPFIDGPRKIGDVHYHEYGHQVAITKFPGEVEAIVNFLMVAAFNNEGGIGGDLDTTFRNSFVPSNNMYLNDAAEQRMITENFRLGKPRDISNTVKDEVRYQQRGYAHYAEIVKLFGWCALENYWYSESNDFMNGIEHKVNDQDQDDRIYRMSIAANIDLRPLFHFYGIHPKDAEQLNKKFKDANLPSSSEIYNRLIEYKSILPKNNAEFMAHALERFPGGLNPGANQDPNYGIGWYYKWSTIYNDSHGTQGLRALDSIIQLYYPDGKPNSVNEKTSCNINLTPGKITGLVKDIDGKPMADVEIVLDDFIASTENTKVKTNFIGYYEFNGLPQGNYRLKQIQPSSYESVLDNDQEFDGDVSDTSTQVNNEIDVTLVPGEDDNQNNFIEKKSTVVVKDILPENLAVNIFPNPTNHFIMIELLGLNEENLSIELYDILGKMVQKASLPKGITNAYLDLQSLSPGDYLIKIFGSKSQMSRQVVITR